MPAGAEIHFETANEAPEPSVYRTESHGVGHTWEARAIDRRGRPLTADACADEPYVVWSTWTDWKGLGDAIDASIDERAVLSDALRDSVAKLVEHEPTLWSKAEAVADFIEETTRTVHYPDSFWEFSSRPASRTWETAYGHRLDRAVLGAALFWEAGCNASPAFRGRGFGGIDESVPGLARFEGMYLWIEGDGVEACYDPGQGSLVRGRSPFAGRAAWIPTKWNDPTTGFGDGRLESALRVVLTLEAGEDGWNGTGFVRATGDWPRTMR